MRQARSRDSDFFQYWCQSLRSAAVPEKYALVGEHTGRMYKLGDSIRIVVDNVDIDRHEIDFQLAE